MIDFTRFGVWAENATIKIQMKITTVLLEISFSNGRELIHVKFCRKFLKTLGLYHFKGWNALWHHKHCFMFREQPLIHSVSTCLGLFKIRQANFHDYSYSLYWNQLDSNFSSFLVQKQSPEVLHRKRCS